MSIRLRFSSGLVVQYNDANFASHDGDRTRIYESSNKKTLFASLPLTADIVVEFQHPCWVRKEPADQTEDIRNELRLLKNAIAKLSRSKNG